MAKGLIAVLALLILLVPSASAAGEDGPDRMLVDFGDGGVHWYDLAPGASVQDTISSTLSSAGVQVEFEDMEEGSRVLSVGGRGPSRVGTESTPGMQECGWRVYSWNGVSWEPEPDDVDLDYLGGSIALGYYPEGSASPAATPDYEDVWTCYRGDSSSSGVGSSCGPDSVAVPLEWHNDYHGAVDSSILYADGLIYHTVAGAYGSVGMEGLAWLYCLDPVNKQVAWSASYSDSGNIEITTPVIVGDVVVLTSGNWHVYCLDRFTGEPLAELYPEGSSPDMCNAARSTGYKVFKGDPQVAKDRIHVSAGVSNAVYDRGALYFNTSDGVTRCYSVDREEGFQEIWTHVPEDSLRGCFYYYPPCLADLGGERVLVAGNYAGMLTCVSAVDGEPVWGRRVLDLSGSPVGAVTSVSVCPGERALVCYSDGGMSSSSGGLMLVDLRDGSTIWQKSLLSSRPVVFGDRFYAYVSYTPDGEQAVTEHDTGAERGLVSGYYSFWVSDCSIGWVQDTDALSVGGMTYCDGRVYSMDYSPGTEGSLGGWVWCIDADTGVVVWKAKASPYNGTAYSMCAPTVADGKVLVGNDYGAVYVMSEVRGVERAATSDVEYESQGLAHWSWLVLFAFLAAFTLCAARLYRGA